MGVELYWIPIGAGGVSVRRNGQVHEALTTLAQHRRRYDLPSGQTVHATLRLRLCTDD